MFDDVRFGWRKLRQQPSFTAIAVLTLALGIGATSAVFSLIQGVLLTPPPYRQPEQLVLDPIVPGQTAQPGPPQRWSGRRNGWSGRATRSRSRRSPRTSGRSTSSSLTTAANRSKACSSPETISGCSDSTPLLGRTFQESETAVPAGRRSSSSATSSGSGSSTAIRTSSAKRPHQPPARRRRRSSASCRQGSASFRRRPPRRSRTTTSTRRWISGCRSHRIRNV